MATVSPSSDQAAAELLQNLSLDSLDAPLQDPKPIKKVSAVKHTTGGMSSQMNGFSKPYERSAISPLPDFMNSSVFYNPSGYPSSTYYYGGFNGSSVNDWDSYGSSNGVDLPPGVYGDYQNGYGYAPYGTYSSPGGSMGPPDAPLYSPQHFHYPNCYFPPSVTSNGHYTASGVNSTQKDVSTLLVSNSVQSSTGTAKGHQSSWGSVVSHRNNMSKTSRPNYQNPNMKSSDYYGWGGFPSASSGNISTFSYGHNYSSTRNQNLLPLPHLMGMQSQQVGSGMDQAGFTSRLYPTNSIYGQYSSSFRRGTGYASNSYEPRINGRGWLAFDSKYSSRDRGCNVLSSGNETVDGLNEVNKGPRAKGFKDQKDSEPNNLTEGGQSVPVNVKRGEDNLNREQYNKDDFPESHADAKFFIIKSYSEDDVHKSIKYCVWASTPNGNKKLNAAFKEAQEQGKSGRCPVFLLFSVNASGQFVGLAEMVGPVDFDRSMEYWQQDKWAGCFPVKWHFVKDVPNSMLRHIKLENNENKPVTNSRDTQEIRLEQGNEIIKIFKSHNSRTCLLGDFEFYEGREKAMQEKKAKQQQLHKKVGDDVTPGMDRDGSTSKQASQISFSVDSSLTEEGLSGAVETGADDLKFLKDNGPVVEAEDTKAISNGVHNC